MKEDSDHRKKRGPVGLILICVMCAAMLAAAAFAVLSVTDESNDNVAVGAPGDYDLDDIAFINALIADKGIPWTPALSDGSSVPSDWLNGYGGDGVIWDTSVTPMRAVELSIAGLGITGSLDFTALTELIILQCSDNSIDSITVSGMSKLENLNADNNLLTGLDLSGCDALTSLYCEGNQIAALDVSVLIALQELYCGHNLLDALDVSGHTGLIKLYCEGNSISALDLTGMTLLEELYCGTNNFTQLDLSSCTSLNQLGCENNGLTELDVSVCTSLMYLYCYYNSLVTLDVSGLVDLAYLECYGNWISDLNISGCIYMLNLDCRNNFLETLDVSGFAGLSYLDCSGNWISYLNISGCTSLAHLDCYQNMIETLDVSGLAALTYLDCSNNRISTLSLSGCTSLKELYCEINRLTALDVTGFPLTDFWCYNNWLTSVTGFPLSSFDGIRFKFYTQFTGTVLTFTNTGLSITLSRVGTPIASVDVSVGVSGGLGTNTFSDTWGLPGGITISSAGVISGALAATVPAGTAMIMVTDGQAFDRILIRYDYAPMAYDGTLFDIPSTQVGTAITNINVYEAITGGSGDFWIEGFLLPPGIVIDPIPGTIRGTPSEAAAAGAGYVTVRDRVTGITYASEIPVTFGAMTWPPLVFADSPSFDIPASAVGTAIANIDVSGAASGGDGVNYAFSASGLPAGISISAAGVISGTPTAASAAGTATITVASGGLTASITIAFGEITGDPVPPGPDPQPAAGNNTMIFVAVAVVAVAAIAGVAYVFFIRPKP